MNASHEKQQRFLALFEPVQPNLERFALAVTGERERARDVVAETALIAYERFDSLRSPEAFLSFLFTIATRVHRREMKGERRMERVDDKMLKNLLDPGLPPDAAADIAAVYAALAKLPEKQREGVVLFEIMGVPMKEIREIQGGTLTSVKVRIFRGRKRLAELLGVDDAKRSEQPAAKRREARPDDSAVGDTEICSIGVKPL